MPLADTIEQAAEIAGSQTALARMLEMTPQNVSDIKRGKRVCGLKTRIKIAEIAGVSRLRTIFEYFEDSLDPKDEYEAQAKATIRAMLDAFPPETDELEFDAPKKKTPGAISSQGVSWRKRNFPTYATARLAGFFYAYFKLECPGLWTRYRARFMADSETPCSCASDLIVCSPVW